MIAMYHEQSDTFYCGEYHNACFVVVLVGDLIIVYFDNSEYLILHVTYSYKIDYDLCCLRGSNSSHEFIVHSIAYSIKILVHIIGQTKEWMTSRRFRHVQQGKPWTEVHSILSSYYIASRTLRREALCSPISPHTPHSNLHIPEPQNATKKHRKQRPPHPPVQPKTGLISQHRATIFPTSPAPTTTTTSKQHSGSRYLPRPWCRL